MVIRGLSERRGVQSEVALRFQISGEYQSGRIERGQQVFCRRGWFERIAWHDGSRVGTTLAELERL